VLVLRWYTEHVLCELRLRQPFVLLVCVPTGAVYPAAGPLDKAKGRVLSSTFGPATSWHITYNTAGFTVVVATKQGSYQVGHNMCQKHSSVGS
jgi:hypothetical protein